MRKASVDREAVALPWKILYVGLNSSGGELRMDRSHRRLLRALTMLALCAAFGLAACGRKADLDPPSATVAPPPPQASPRAWGEAPPQSAPPPAPSSGRRSFPLDPLLN
jgi:predicted small lipoprotein YifL